MNLDRRYCQNRVQKRKTRHKSLSPKENITTAEEERQFKLSRFVQDVNKFIEHKETTLEQPRRGLFQNGKQTKFYSRGSFGKEITARLDEDLQQIISLANKGSNENRHHYRHHFNEPRITEASTAVVHPSPQLIHTSYSNSHHLRGTSRESSVHLPRHPIPLSAHSSSSERGKAPTDAEVVSDTALPEKLDSQLYPEFTRIVNLSSVESKSMQFKDKSYVTALKKKLLKIYRHGRKENENSEELSCPSDVQKSSVATSPFRSPSPLSESQPGCSYTGTQHQHSSGRGQGFTSISFVQEPFKSSIQFLEETIGPGSSCKSVSCKPSPEPRWPCEPDIPSTACQRTVHQDKPKYCAHQWSGEPDIPSTACQRTLHQDKPKYCARQWSGEPDIPSTVCQRTVHQDKPKYCAPLPRDTTVHPPHNKMMPFDGGGDRLEANMFNWFLPPCEEDSPEFQYFPRRMF